MVQSTSDPIALDVMVLDEPFILADASLNSVTTSMPSSYRDVVYPAKRFSDLEPAALNELVDHLKQVDAFYSGSAVHTTPRVAKELAHAAWIFKDKLCNLETSERRPVFRGRDKKRWSDDEVTDEPGNRELFRDICWYFDRIAHKAEQSLFDPRDPSAFDLLYAMVIKVAGLTHAKIDYGPRHGAPAKTTDTHADEELVAAALYRCMVEKEPCSIVTADTDIHRTARWVHRYLGAMDHGFRVYCRALGSIDYVTQVDTSQEPGRFYLPSAHERIVDVMQETLHRLPIAVAKPFL